MKTYLIIPVLLLLLFAGCSDKGAVNNSSDEIEYIEVILSTNPLLSVTSDNFRNKQSNEVKFDDSYTHQIPTEFTAYFIAAETKGEYNFRDIVHTVTVNSGDNPITVPKMKLKIHVTNYDIDSDPKKFIPGWWNWSGIVNSLPKTSDELYMAGTNTIDYNRTEAGAVDLINPYSSVMIKDNQWVTGIPVVLGDNRAEYSFVGQPDENGHRWLNKYINLDTSDTGVPLLHLSDEYKIDHKLEANKIYQFIFDGSVPLTEDGSLMIGTSGMEEGGATEIPYTS